MNEQSKIGPLIGAIIVVVLIVLGGIYLWNARFHNEQIFTPPTEAVATSSEAEAPTDSLNRIEKDVGGVSLDDLGAELDVIDSNLAP